MRGLRLDARTDARGALDLPIEPGVYEVVVTADSGHFAGHSNVEIETGAVVTLPALLQPGIRFEAALVDSRTGAPIAGEKVWIREGDRPGSMSPVTGSERVSDLAGKLVWEALPPGRARLGFEARRYSRSWSSDSVEAKRFGLTGPQPHDLSFEIAEGMAPVAISMETSVTVTGRVTSPAGDAVPGAIVSLSRHGGLGAGTPQSPLVVEHRQVPSTTDESGRYTLHLPAGNGTMYSMVAHDRDGRWANAVGESFHSAPGDSFAFALELTEGAVIEGRVVDGDGNPIAAIAVTAAPTDGRESPYFLSRATTAASACHRRAPVSSTCIRAPCSTRAHHRTPKRRRSPSASRTASTGRRRPGLDRREARAAAGRPTTAERPVAHRSRTENARDLSDARLQMRFSRRWACSPSRCFLISSGLCFLSARSTS